MTFRFLSKHGPFKATLVLTVGAVIASIFLKIVIMYFLESRVRSADIIAAAVIPAIIAPAFTVYLFALVDRLSVAEKRLQRLVTVDDLTQVYNRRHFMETAEEAMVDAARSGLALAVLMLDVDHFKRINDVHGHLAGDEVLRRLAGKCREAVGSSGIVARLGGEEFGFLLPRTGAADAVRFAERLRVAAESTPVDYDGVAISYTVCIGVSISENATRLDDVLKAADKALYAAKAQGRNQVVLLDTSANG